MHLLWFRQLNTTHIKKISKKKIRHVKNKIPDVSSLVTATFLNTKIDEVENKIPNDSKYVTIHKFNKFIGKTFDTKLK